MLINKLHNILNKKELDEFILNYLLLEKQSNGPLLIVTAVHDRV